MKMKANRPFYKDGKVILEGEEFTTTEQHGRELVTRFIAEESSEADDKPDPKRRGKKDE